MPRVTVIIPTYNYARVLPYSIRSALWQTFSDFELLVIGDHCTDESESVVTAIGDRRVRWINLPKNIGHQSGPNNEGLRQARANWSHIWVTMICGWPTIWPWRCRTSTPARICRTV